jgi:Domain of unknown function (DUF4263)
MNNEQPIMQSEDERYFNAKRPGRTYTSKSIEVNLHDGTKKHFRYVSKVIDQKYEHAEVSLKGETVLRVTRGGRQQIIAKVWEDTRGIFILTIQRYTIDGNLSKEQHFSFSEDEINTLKQFLESVEFIDIQTDGKQRFEDDEIRTNIEKFRSIIATNPNLDVLIEMAQTKITKADVVALAYRREQLNAFGDLLGANANEAIWQAFFEKNVWIFGYGLNYVFNSPLEGRKLEQMVRGSDITSAGKRVDGLLKTRGIISSLGLVEIKTPDAKLLKQVSDPYRRD